MITTDTAPNRADALARADAHIHLFEHGFRGDDATELDRYEQLRSTYGITAALIIGYEGEQRYRGNNRYILDLAATRSWMHPVAYVRACDSPVQLADLSARGYIGASAYLAAPDAALNSWPSASVTALTSLPLLSVNASPRALQLSSRVLAEADETLVLVSHLGSPGPDACGRSLQDTRALLGPLLALAHYEHVVVKLSGLYAIDPGFPHDGARAAVEVLLDAFGPGRMVWGSDFSPGEDAVGTEGMMQLPDWLTAQMTPTALAQLLGGTLHTHLARARARGRT